MEYSSKEHGLELDLECNPNIHPDAFHALVFVKVRRWWWCWWYNEEEEEEEDGRKNTACGVVVYLLSE